MEVTGSDVKYAKDNKIAQTKTTYIEAFKAVCLLEGADPKHYCVLWYDIRNDTIRGDKTFPKMVVKYFDILNKWKLIQNNTTRENLNNRKGGKIGQSGWVFLQHDNNQKYGKSMKVIDGLMVSRITCYTCIMKGQYFDQLPNKN